MCEVDFVPTKISFWAVIKTTFSLSPPLLAVAIFTTSTPSLFSLYPSTSFNIIFPEVVVALVISFTAISRAPIPSVALKLILFATISTSSSTLDCLITPSFAIKLTSPAEVTLSKLTSLPSSSFTVGISLSLLA